MEALQGGGFIVSRISYLSNGPGWVSTQIHDSNGLKYNAETTVYATSECIDQNYYAMERRNLLQLDNGKFVIVKGVDCDGGPYYRLLGNDTAPALVKNNLVINRESTKFTLTENNLSATDPDNDDSLLIFEVSDAWFGHFEFITAPEIVITSFTQQQLAEGRVRFVRDEFEDLPRYKVAVKDGIVSTSPTDAFIFETGSNSRLSTSLLSVSISQKSSASSSQSSSFITSSIHPDEPLSVSSQEVGGSSTLPAVDNGKNNAWIGVVTGLLGGLLFVGCLAGGGILYWRWKKQLAEDIDIDLEKLEYVGDEPVPLIKRSELQFGKELGRGAAGTVFKGTWKGSEVAIKQLPLYMTEYDPQLLAEFKKETTVMCKLRHPNIVQFFGLYRDQEHYCIVMEYMSRGSLDRLLYNPQIDLPWRPVRWRIIRDITYGLWYLHDQQPPLLHRDLKSPNILLDEQLRAKITDFGVAKITEDATKTMTKGIGTLCWMAPEVMRGAEATGKNYSNKADIYSYGMILWELAARELPYKDLNQFEIPRRVSEGERPEIPQDCPQPLAHLIRWCWHANPDIRPVMPDAKRALDDIKESRDDNLIQFDSTSTSTMVY